MATRPSKATANKLWAMCGNECANPVCGNEVLRHDPASNTLEKVGEIAHIYGNNRGSNRYDENLSDEERQHFDNLLILCPTCHTEQPDGVDVPSNKARFPPKLLKEWKRIHFEKVQGTRDRNWICHPNSATEFRDGSSVRVDYWIDRHGRPRLYAAEELAIVNELFPIVVSFSRIQGMLRMIDDTKGKPIDPSHQTMNDAVIKTLFDDSRRINSHGDGWLGQLAEAMQVAQDVTLGELFLMMVEGGLRDREKHMARGRELMAEKAKVVDPAPKITQLHRQPDERNRSED